MVHLIRIAQPHELARIQHIEDDAGQRFLSEGFSDAEMPGLPVEMISTAMAEGLLFVAVDADDTPVAFALCLLRPGALHLEELDVLLAQQGQGLGRSLLDQVIRAAQERGLPKVTLTTYRDISFNAPFYARYGFSELHEIPTWLQAIREEERAKGLDVKPRICMSLAV